MRRFLPAFCCTVLVLTSLLVSEAATHHGPTNPAPPQIRIQNIRPVEVSSGELRVTVDYTYPLQVQGRPVINVAALEAGGIWRSEMADTTQLPVQSGSHTVSLMITKNARGEVFTSVEVRVCIYKPGTTAVCADHPYRKTWTNGAAQYCSISGRLSGSLEGDSYPDHAGPPTRVRLRRMFIQTRDGNRWTAEISNGNYLFRNLEAGVHYSLYPDGFESQPGQTTIRCRGRFQHRANFMITRPKPQG